MKTMVEWEITMKCNYRCGYCTNLDASLLPVLDKTKIKEFVQFLGEEYPGVEIFVFGGEPFVHPHIDFIIETFNTLKVPYVIQTNFSKKSVHEMKKISEPFNVNISIHPTEISREKIQALLQTPLPHVTIKDIDVMYVGKQSVDYYLDIKDNVEYEDLYLTPVTDFGDGESGKLLSEYNELRKSAVYQKIINFENIKHFGQYRSELWGDPTFITKGKPCMYNGHYFLYGPNMDVYNCCYREKHDGICSHEKCFLM